MDLLIPFHNKDAGILPLCIKACREFLHPTPTRILCIGSPDYPEVKAVIDEAGGKFMDENKVIPNFTRAQMPRCESQGIDRTGWYYKQLLTFGGAFITPNQFYTVWDADLIPVAPITLVNEDGKYVFSRPIPGSQQDQWHRPYFAAYRSLFGYGVERQPSFIADHMILDRGYVLDMLAEINRNSGRPWYEPILWHVKGFNISEFADYETYGNWLSKHHPESFVSTPFKVMWLPCDEVVSHESNAAQAVAKNYQQIVYHNRPGFNHMVPNPLAIGLNVEAGKI